MRSAEPVDVVVPLYVQISVKKKFHIPLNIFRSECAPIYLLRSQLSSSQCCFNLFPRRIRGPILRIQYPFSINNDGIGFH